MKKTLFTLLILLLTDFACRAEDFYLPLTGYSRFDKATKKSEEVQHMGVCCLEGSDMFIYINKTKIDCKSVEEITVDNYSNQTVTLSAQADVCFNCDAAVPMRIVLNFVNNQLTNIYLKGSEEDYEFYLGNF